MTLSHFTQYAQRDPLNISKHLCPLCFDDIHLHKEGLLFPELLEPEASAADLEPTLLCAELVVRGEQDCLINDWMACVVGQYVYALLRRQPITTFASFISLEGMSVRSLPICREELTEVLSSRNRIIDF